jgi:transposase
MRKERKRCSAKEKVAILRRHLLDKEPLSKLCDELGLQSSMFYRSQNEFFDNGAAPFERKGRANHSAAQERIRRRARGRASSSRRRRISTGTSMFPTSTPVAHSTNYAACRTATAGLSGTGTCGKPTLRSSWKRPRARQVNGKEVQLGSYLCF